MVRQLMDGEDESRRRGLRKMRTIATALLGVAMAIFLATHIFTDLSGVWGFVARASEAAMIGAIADWFAVTALFRHPMGLPIPHTAIIPSRKDALGESLSTFVAVNFLRADTVAPKIRNAHITQRLGSWLDKPANRAAVVDRSGKGLDYVLAQVPDETIAAVAEKVIVPKLIAARKSPALGALLREIVEDGSHHKLVDLIVSEAHAWLDKNPQVVVAIVENKSPSWAPKFVNDALANRINREVLTWLVDVRDQRGHRARTALDTWLLELAGDLCVDSPLSLRAERVLDELLVQPGLVTAIVDVWASLRRLLRGAVLDDEGEIQQRMSALVNHLAQRMREDNEFATMVDERMAGIAGTLTESFGGEIASVISDTISQWDAREASDRIELYVGKDLQYIRINGTVIGAIVGVFIHALTLVLPA